MLSKSSKYAIRAVLYLAQNNDKKIGSKEIAENLAVPAPFLAKILQELTREKVISSIKGPGGGFFVSDEDKNNAIADIIDCIDGLHKFDQCFLGRVECNHLNPCVVHHLYAPFKEKLLFELKSKSIEEMAYENAQNQEKYNTLLSINE